MEAIGKVLQVDPHLVDDYLRYHVEVDDAAHGRIWFEDSDGLHDDVCRSPLSWLHHPDAPGFGVEEAGNEQRGA